MKWRYPPPIEQASTSTRGQPNGKRLCNICSARAEWRVLFPRFSCGVSFLITLHRHVIGDSPEAQGVLPKAPEGLAARRLFGGVLGVLAVHIYVVRTLAFRQHLVCGDEAGSNTSGVEYYLMKTSRHNVFTPNNWSPLQVIRGWYTTARPVQLPHVSVLPCTISYILFWVFPHREACFCCYSLFRDHRQCFREMINYLMWEHNIHHHRRTFHRVALSVFLSQIILTNSMELLNGGVSEKLQ